MKRRIRQNVWGNWYGYLGNRRADDADFGVDVVDAFEWLIYGSVDSASMERYTAARAAADHYNKTGEWPKQQ